MLRKPLSIGKKGIMENIQSLVLGVVLIAIFLGLGLVITQEFHDAVDAGSSAQNATDDILTEMEDIPSWIGIIIVVVIMVGILGLVLVLRRYNR